MMAYLHLSLLLVFFALFTELASSGEASSQTKPNCECFLVSGPDPGPFQNYEFYDFRKVPLKQRGHTNPAGAHPLPPNDDKRPHFEDGPQEPADDVDDDTKRLFGPDATLLSHTPFAKSWVPQTWLRRPTPSSPVTHANSKRNVFFARDPSNQHGPDSTFLVLRAVRNPDHVSTAEIETAAQNFLHASLRVRLRLFTADLVPPPSGSDGAPSLSASGPPSRGACAGIFTYHSTGCESDIEILTSDPPDQVRYANQPDYDPVTDTLIPGASAVVRTPAPWTAWSTHRLDWFPSESRWYQDGAFLHSIRYGIPDKPSMLVVNLWSDGGFWSGDLPVGESVYLGIEWIEVAYNASKSDSLDSPIGKPSHGHPHRPATPIGEVGAHDDGCFDGDDADSSAGGCCWVDM